MSEIELGHEKIEFLSKKLYLILDFKVQFIGPSVNAYIGRRSNHYYEAQKSQATAETIWALKQAKPEISIEKPVYMFFQPLLGKGRRAYDWINYSLAAKMIEDGIVQYKQIAYGKGKRKKIIKRGYLHDDSPKFVHGGVILRAKKTGWGNSYMRVNIYSEHKPQH